MAAENVLDRDFPISPTASGKQKDKWDNDDGGMIAFDFDSDAEGIDHNTLEGDAAKGWLDLFHEGKSDPEPLPMEGSPLPGDSGGPALMLLDGRWGVIGVCSYGTGYPTHKKRAKVQYGEVAVYARTLNHLEWMRRVMGE